MFYADRWSGGGVENYLINHLPSLDHEYFEYQIVVAQKDTEALDELLKEKKISLHVLLNKRYHSPIIRTIVAQKEIRNYLFQKKPDILWINMSNAVSGKIACHAKRAGIKIVVAHAHAAGIADGWTAPIKRIAHAFARRYYDRFIDSYAACSNKAAEWMFSNSKLKKIHFLPNGIDTKRFEYNFQKRVELRKELGLNGCYVIGMVGRLMKGKNHLFLLQAFNMIAKKDPSFRLLLVGDGDKRKTIERFVYKEKLEAQVVLIGNTRYPENYYQIMDLFAFPTQNEALGMAVIEAQCAGLPCCVSPQVPQETNITEAITFLDICSFNIWGDFFQSQTKNSNKQRKYESELVEKSIYNLKSSATIFKKVLVEVIKDTNE